MSKVLMNTDIDLCGISQRNWDAFSTNTGGSEELAADPITSSSSSLQNKPEIGKKKAACGKQHIFCTTAMYSLRVTGN